MLKHRNEKENFITQTANQIGFDFVNTYSLDNAEKEDLFWQMNQLNLGHGF